jgi:cytochrome oxidase Cu insertion factor (SCO1/SenC/PrrC family)
VSGGASPSLPRPIGVHGDAAPSGGTPTQRLIWALLGATLVLVIGAAAWRLYIGAGRPADLPVYGRIPPFTLVERSGRTVSADDLAGHVWIASFVFTRCGGMCPALTTTMAALLRRLPAHDDDVRAVSVTVDPARDDPETLRRYADRFGADPSRWLFLTGAPEAIEHVVRDGFRLSIAELPPGERERSPEPITHSDRFVLVDRELRIRGYYHGTDPDGVASLERDLALLTRRGP